MQERLINASESLFTLGEDELLRTPIASEAEGGAVHPVDAKANGNSLKLGWQLLGHFGHIEPKLPTPNTMEHREIKTTEQIAELKKKSPGGYRNLREVVVNEVKLLPTITAQDGKNNGGASQHNRNTKPLNAQVMDSADWGKYEPAIRRWEEITGRKSPEPTLPDGKDGKHRLNSRFAEWIMGLPDGWITSVGIKRNAELKACGNGVVPQQAELALRLLLNGENIDS